MTGPDALPQGGRHGTDAEHPDEASARDAAFERDVLTLLPDVARFARSLARDPASADDLTQETVLQAYRGYHTFRPGSEARRWLFTICRHAFLRQQAQAGRLVNTGTGEDEELDALASVLDHAAVLAAGERDLFDRIDVGPAISRALDELGEPFRIAVVLVDVEGQSYEEAAAIAGVPVGTIRSRLFRARRLLQQRLLTHARDAGLTGRVEPPAADRRLDEEPG